MIFAVIGTSSWNFDRLIKELDEIAPDIDESIVMQIGNSDYIPKNSEFFRFKPKNEVENIYKNADTIICHAGIGSILSSVKYNKNIILVPRRRKYGELLDDHQIEIARKLEQIGIPVVWNIKELKSTLLQIREKKLNIGEERIRFISLLVNSYQI